MNTRFTRPRPPPLAAWLFTLALLAPAAYAAAPEAKAPSQRTRGACTPVKGDARDNCLSEASTLRASSRPSAPDENAEQLARNALRRCEPLREPDRQDCVARIQGQGTTTGSVASGGIYRELVTREVGAVPTSPAASSPAVPTPAR